MISSIESIKNIQISKFDYPLPDERIARHPLSERDSCKLLYIDSSQGISHRSFSEITQLIPSDSLLVCNDTRVINARIRFRKNTGSTIEIFLLEPISPRDYVLMFQTRGRCRWSCLVGNLKRWKAGTLEKTLLIEGREVVLRAIRRDSLAGNAHEIEFSWDGDITFASVVDAAGYIPIPPYLKRESEESDAEDYQTVYARIEGSVAAPTAGLHFTAGLFDKLKDNGVAIAPVTLHVGAGTFQPVKSAEIGEHPMHTEVFTVNVGSLMAIRDAVANGAPVTAVGTTSVRTIESLPILGFKLMTGDESLTVSQWEAYSMVGEKKEEERTSTLSALDAIIDYMEKRGLRHLTASTSIMIAPGFQWRIVDRMITNFHQPQSTLLLLVSSFLGQTPDTDTGLPLWKRAYAEALANDYRFLSYGDACLFERRNPETR